MTGPEPEAAGSRTNRATRSSPSFLANAEDQAPAAPETPPALVSERIRWRLPLALFFATLATTLWVGGALGIAAASPELFGGAGAQLSAADWIWTWIVHGAPYSLSLLSILFAHEMGHWLAARAWGVQATLPYFLPMPLTLVGTRGAFIRVRSPFPHRRALLDVGLAGPFAGFVVALPLLAYGVSASRPGVGDAGDLQFGEPIAFRFFAALFGPTLAEGEVLYLSPVGLAAWFGLLLTAINLLPMGQLDGGPALYALFRGRARKLSRGVVLAMAPLALLSPTWLVWALLALLFGAWRAHPPTLDDEAPLPPNRRWVAFAALLVLVVCFTPEPVILD